MAEIELSIFSKQCLKRRIGDEQTLRREIAALEHERNEAKKVIDWRFTTTEALAPNFEVSTQQSHPVLLFL